jgi:hypothetical protein
MMLCTPHTVESLSLGAAPPTWEGNVYSDLDNPWESNPILKSNRDLPCCELANLGAATWAKAVTILSVAGEEVRRLFSVPHLAQGVQDPVQARSVSPAVCRKVSSHFSASSHDFGPLKLQWRGPWVFIDSGALMMMH